MDTRLGGAGTGRAWAAKRGRVYAFGNETEQLAVIRKVTD